MNPIHLLRAAAVRAKMNSDKKQEEISKLQLQKETLRHFSEKNALDN